MPSVLKTKYENYRVLVVDNGSKDGSVDWVRSKFPEVELLVNRRNLGYAEGNNRGIRLALRNGADYIALLNQDIKVEPNWLQACVDELQKDNSLGIISPMQYNYEGTALDQNFSILLMGSREYREDIENNRLREAYDVPWAIGASLLIRRNLIERVGLFDPLYFCYGEETDLCRRARFRGFRTAIVTTGIVYHWHTFIQAGEQDPRLNYMAARAQAIYLLKNPAYSFYRNMKAYYCWGGIKNTWSSLNDRFSKTRITLEIITYLPQLLYKKYREKRSACYL